MVNAAVGVHDHPYYRLGLIPPDPAKVRAMVQLPLAGEPSLDVPPAVEHLGQAQPLMVLGGNSQFGTCWPTSIANSAILTLLFCRGERVTVTDEQVFALYRAAGNPDFDPATGQGDQGVDPTVGFKALMEQGIEVTHLTPAGDPDPQSTEVLVPVCYASASVPDVATLRAITYAAGAALMCLDLQQSQQGQTAGGLWDYRPAPAWGGHAVLGGSYSSPASAAASDEVVETWGRQVGCTDRFLSGQLSSVFVAVWRDLWSADPFAAGVPREQLAAAYMDVTGREIGAPGWPQ